MSAFGPAGAIAGSSAGLNQAERAQASDVRKKDEKQRARRTTRDDNDLVVVDTEAVEAIRNLKSNDQEESREDRESGEGQYRPDGTVAKKRSKLDIEG